MRWSRYILALLLVTAAPPASGYSVLTHEAIIDRNWKDGIKPLLLRRFPDANEDRLREAHAYAYGGAIIQDMGYYPFGNHFFSDLTHYTRSGDFVLALIRDSQDLDEYAFALGALAHYAADNLGHPIAVNRSVPLVYPKLERRFGSVVTYEDNPAAHLKTEFGFDVIEVAQGQYASGAYHDFIGFKVSKPVLERAFEDTYCVPLHKLFHDFDLALGTYRFAVSRVIPETTKAAWSAKKDDIEKLQAGMTRRRYVYRLSRRDYQRDWKEHYQKPGFGAEVLAFLFRLIPKVGPFQGLAFKVPPAGAERLFAQSFNETMDSYHQLLVQVGESQLKLENENFDVGRLTRRGDYELADQAYEKLLEHLADSGDKATPELRADILSFYGSSEVPLSAKSTSTLGALRTASPQ